MSKESSIFIPGGGIQGSKSVAPEYKPDSGKDFTPKKEDG